ncbi:hypothetical protein Tco_0830001 [Tanacetum coccineum]
MDEEFTTTAYPNVQENLKLPTEGEVRLEEPASSVGTRSSLQNLDKELSFTNQFLSENLSTCPHSGSSTTTNNHSNHMVEANQALEEILEKQGSRLYKLENLNIPNQVSKAVDEIITYAVDWAIESPLRDRFRDLLEADMKDILHHRMWESNSYQAHEDHKIKKKKRRDSPKTPPRSPPHPLPPAGSSGTPGASGASGSSQLPPPPPPLSTNQRDQSTGTDASRSSKTTTSAEYTA